MTWAERFKKFWFGPPLDDGYDLTEMPPLPQRPFVETTEALRRKDNVIWQQRVENGELVTSLNATRGQVSLVNYKLKRTKEQLRNHQEALKRHKEQLALDRAFIEKLKSQLAEAENVCNSALEMGFDEVYCSCGVGRGAPCTCCTNGTAVVGSALRDWMARSQANGVS